MPAPRITKIQWAAFLTLLALFAGFNLLAVTASEGFHHGLLTAAGTLLGPMTGAISRGLQNCCLEFSLGLLPYALPFALLAFGSILIPSSGSIRHLRLGCWILGWTAWFFSGLISFGHALT